MLILIQFVLMTGIVWFTAAANVYLRDARNVVEVATAVFYVTPVFYDLRRVPEDVRRHLELQPHDDTRGRLEGVFCSTAACPTSAGSGSWPPRAALALMSFAVFRRLEGGFADEL